MSEPFIFTVEGSRLIAADAWTAERLDSFRKGTVVKAKTLVRPRSLPFQGFYWVHLAEIVKATECAATDKHLHRGLLNLCGFVSPIYNKSGGIVEYAIDSTAFDAMKEDEFHTYVEHAKRALAEQLGIVWDDYTRKERAA